MYKYLREDIKRLEPYKVEDIEYNVKLDANEGIDWIENLNRYPEDSSIKLKKKIGEILKKEPEEILIGNGSSELIDYVMKAYLESNEVVAGLWPDFTMYEIYTLINRGRYESYPLNNMKELDTEGFIKFIDVKKPKIIIISNPNNPTGTMIDKEDIEKILNNTDGMVIIDQAYIEFSNEFYELDIDKFKNLIILRTFSKALGLAGARLGYMIGNKETISYINRVRSPYNVNTLSQNLGIKALKNIKVLKESLEIVKSERKRVKEELENLGFRPLPSETNFLFFAGNKDLQKSLLNKGVLIRGFTGNLEGFYRVSIGTPRENNIFLESLKEVGNEKSKYK